jgi:hypothetical protein
VIFDWLSVQKTRKRRVCLMEVLAGMGVGEQQDESARQAGKSRFTLVDSTHLSRQSALYIYTYKRRVRFPLSTPGVRGSARRVTSRRRCVRFRRRKCARGGLARWFSGATSADRTARK